MPAEHELFLSNGEVHRFPKIAEDNPVKRVSSVRSKIEEMKLPKPGRMTATEMLVVFNDTQLLRHCDEQSFGAFLKFVESYKDKITHIVANGDIVDMEQANHFGYDESMAGTMQDEIDSARWVYSYLSKTLPRATKVLVDGNHEDRYSNLFKDSTSGIKHWLKTYDEQFSLTKLGWKEYPYGKGQAYRFHEMIFWHGKKAGAKADIAKTELDDNLESGCSGHINRNQFKERVTASGKYLFWMVTGGFSKNNLDYMKAANTGWSQGFGVIYYNPEVGLQPHLIPIRHGNPRFVFEGQLFDGSGFQIPIARHAYLEPDTSKKSKAIIN